jgi:15-cis-phytoene synthase
MSPGIEKLRVAESEFAIAKHSKSFSLASRLLPRQSGEEAAIVYAWCRRADDAIDLREGPAQEQALVQLRQELAELYGGGVSGDPVLAAFREVLVARAIPMQYPAELLAGMEMDVRGQHYASLEELLSYCYRVASTVGLMMCHVMGVSHTVALRHAAHLGLGMQLTNICRDVMEDWERGRLYLPADVLARHGVSSLRAGDGRAFPPAAVAGCRGVVAELLAVAERYYASSDAGLEYLSLRCAVSVNAARRVYSAIGGEIARTGHDISAPRAVVPTYKKMLACAAALASTLALRVTSFARPFEPVPLETVNYGPELIAL